MISMYGISNCDTVKKARSFLATHNIDYTFIDFKKTAPTSVQIREWAEFFGELPINKKGTTYRKHKEQYEALGRLAQIDFIIANPSLIKRPVLVNNDHTLALGFDEARYSELLL